MDRIEETNTAIIGHPLWSDMTMDLIDLAELSMLCIERGWLERGEVRLALDFLMARAEQWVRTPAMNRNMEAAAHKKYEDASRTFSALLLRAANEHGCVFEITDCATWAVRKV
jgi:hypothetical protein